MERLTDPERELALSYAPQPCRPHLRALWRIDERFGAIVSGTTEAAIGEVRLLWWREALAETEEQRAEPLLEVVKHTLVETAGDGVEWGAMAEGWHALLQEPLEEAELERFAAERGGRLFRLSAEILIGAAPSWIEQEGRAWALTDLGYRITDPGMAACAKAMAQQIFGERRNDRWPARLRALGALAMLARSDATAHNRRQASPRRVARMAWHRLTGR